MPSGTSTTPCRSGGSSRRGSRCWITTSSAGTGGEAYERPFLRLALAELDGDGDGQGDLAEGAADADADGVPDFLAPQAR